MAAQTDWPLIAALYAALAHVAPSPVVELNRAVALGMAVGPAAGLELADALMQEAALADRHLLAAVAAICSRSSAGARKRAPSSSAPPGSPATRASER